MELIIITGLSGAGKSRAAAALEDMGVYCVDNMPVQLLPQLADVFSNMQKRYPRVALVTDIRAWSDASELLYVLEELRSQGLKIRVLYLHADIRTLVKRYKETRRRHPLESDTLRWLRSYTQQLLPCHYMPRSHPPPDTFPTVPL